MARKKDEVETKGEVVSTEVVAEEKILIVSDRSGDVILPCGSKMKFRDVKKLSKEVAEWLLKSFEGEFRILKIEE